MGYYVRFKPSVRMCSIAPAAATILACLYAVAQQLKRDITVTCGNENHVAPSRHVTGEALDVHVLSLESFAIAQLYTAIKAWLGGLFTVLLESPTPLTDPVLAPILTINPNASALHIHIQPAKGTVYPPPAPDRTSNA